MILEGKVEIFLRNRSGKMKRNGEDYVIAELINGMTFGEVSFFSGRQRLAGAKASSYCTLVRIKREDFLQAVEYFHEDFERFKEKQDEILLYDKYATILTNCAICGSYQHLAKHCSSVKYSPYHQTIINVYNRFTDQQRNHQVLRFKAANKFNPLSNLHSLIANAIIIAENYPREVESIEMFNKQWIAENAKGEQLYLRDNQTNIDEEEPSKDPLPAKQLDEFFAIPIKLQQSIFKVLPVSPKFEYGKR